jgi:hypothetical protein
LRFNQCASTRPSATSNREGFGRQKGRVFSIDEEFGDHPAAVIRIGARRVQKIMRLAPTAGSDPFVEALILTVMVWCTIRRQWRSPALR